MTKTRSRFVLMGVLALVLSLTAGLTAGAEAAKKKKKKSPSVSVFNKNTPAAIPDRPPGATAFVGVLDSTITVGKKLKGREVADVDVGLSAVGPANQLADLEFYLRSPNGATSFLTGDNPGQTGATSYGTGNCNTGATTFSDETDNFINIPPSDPPSIFPGTVFSPWAATVQPDGFPLSIFDGGPARGTWTLRAVDDDTANTFTLTCWKLSIKSRAALK
jgi:subtilisin-like proprotein convertase family protein